MKIHLSCQRNNQASSFGHFSFKSFEQRFFFLSSLNKRNFWGNNNSNSALPVLKKNHFLLIFIFYISVTRNVNNKIFFLSFTIQSFYLFKNPPSRQFFKGNSRMWTLAHFKLDSLEFLLPCPEISKSKKQFFDFSILFT